MDKYLHTHTWLGYVWQPSVHQLQAGKKFREVKYLVWGHRAGFVILTPDSWTSNPMSVGQHCVVWLHRASVFSYKKIVLCVQLDLYYCWVNEIRTHLECCKHLRTVRWHFFFAFLLSSVEQGSSARWGGLFCTDIKSSSPDASFGKRTNHLTLDGKSVCEQKA